MGSYLGEIEILLDDIVKLDCLKDKILEDFTADAPKVILEERKLRANEKSKTVISNLKRPPQLVNKPNARSKSTLGGLADSEIERLDTIYNMITINCKYKKRIKNALGNLKDIKKRKKELDEKYAQMIREVFAMKKIKLYKPVRGDVVDEMFAGYLNKAKLDIEV